MTIQRNSTPGFIRLVPNVSYCFQASIGIANLIAMAMEKREGIPFEEAKKKIWLKVEFLL